MFGPERTATGRLPDAGREALAGRRVEALREAQHRRVAGELRDDLREPLARTATTIVSTSAGTSSIGHRGDVALRSIFGR